MARAAAETDVAIAPPGAWVKPRTFTPRAAMKATPAGEDFLLIDQQVNVAAAATYHRHVYQIVSDAGRAGGAQVYIHFDPSYQQVTLHHLRLTRGDATTDRLDPAKIQVIQQERDLDRQLYNGERSALVILDDVRIGDIIDVAYTVQGRNPVFAGKYVDVVALGWAVPVKDEYVRLLTPPGRPIHSQVQGPNPTTSTASTADGQLETEWAAHDLEPIEAEAHTPTSSVVYPFLELTEFATWEEVIAWARPLYEINPDEEPGVVAVADGIEARKVSGEDAIIAALDYVQREVRYLGIEMGPGSHQPSAPDEVLRRRFGDCKDKARLLAAILQRLGFDAYPALVSSSRRDNVNAWLPSPFAFDHVVVSLALASGRGLLDPTMTYQRGATLQTRVVGRYGPYLRIAPGVKALAEAQPERADVSRLAVDETFTIPAFDQPAELVVHSRYEGSLADSMRAYFDVTSREQIGRAYLDFYTRYYPGMSSRGEPEMTDDPTTNVVTVTERYAIKDLFRAESGSRVLHAEFYPAVVSDYVRVPNFSQRRFPYALIYPGEIANTITVQLPEDWDIPPAHHRVDDPAATFESFVSGGGRELKLQYLWTTHSSQVGLPRLESFGAHMNEALAHLGYQLSWNPDAAHFQPNGYTLGWSLLLVAGLAYVSVRLILRRNPQPPDPPVLLERPVDPYSHLARHRQNLEGLGGWLVLVALGLFLRPILLIGTLVRGAASYYDLRVWHALTTPGTTTYRPALGFILPIELTLNLTVLVLSVALILLFFRRSHLFPRLMKVLLATFVVVGIYNVAVFAWFDLGGAGSLAQNVSALIQAAVGAAVWIPYFTYSRRVKLTFVR